MKLIEKYIVKQLFLNSMLILLLILSIFSLSKSVQLIEISLNKGLPFVYLIKLIIFSLPSVIPFLLPIIFCLSIFFTYTRMRTDRELIIIESSGGSKNFVIKPVIIFGLALSFLSLVFTLYLSPKSNQNFRFLINTIKNDYSSSFLQEGIFNTIGKDFTIFLKQRLNDGELRNIFIHDTRDTNKPNTLISKEGYVIKTAEGNKILLKDGSQQFLSQEKKKLSILYFDEYLLSFQTDSNNVYSRIWKTPSERTIGELREPNLSNKDDIKNLQAFKAELIQRFVLPFNIVCFGFLVVTFLLSQEFFRDENTKNNFKILGLIIVLKLVYILFSSVAVKHKNLELLNLVPVTFSLIMGLKILYKLNKNL